MAGRLVRYKTAGRGDPVILLHGLSGSTRWWARNVPALSRHHRVFLVDLPGFGALPDLRTRFVLSEAASWLLGWMEAVGLSSANLVGHSMGGYISIRLAAWCPHAVHRLVLVDSAGVPTGRSLPSQLTSLLLEARHARPALLSVLAGDVLRAGPFTLWRATRDLLGEDVTEDLPSIRAPTLLIWGEHDALVPPSVGHMLQREVTDSQLLVVNGAGHVPMFDRPEEFNATILAFLRGEHLGGQHPLE